MVIFGGASAAAVIKLRCPKCGEIQARARAPERTVYKCRKCGEPMTRRNRVDAAGAKALSAKRRR